MFRAARVAGVAAERFTLASVRRARCCGRAASQIRHCSAEAKPGAEDFEPLYTRDENVADLQLRWQKEQTRQQKRGWLLRMLGYYGAESTRIRQSNTLFFWIKRQARRTEWQDLGLDMGAFYQAHTLYSLHTWIVHRRLLSAGPPGKLVQEELFDRLWDDTTQRIRERGIQELLVNKNLRKVQEASFGSMFAYDDALLHGAKSFADALERNVFLKNSPSRRHADLLAEYALGELEAAHAVPFDEFIWARFGWADPPGPDRPYTRAGVANVTRAINLAAVRAGVEGAESVEDASVGDEQWQEAVNKEGTRYWWSPATLQASLQLPDQPAATNEA
mmetsp:Transcript_13589/g.43419  ORF Transcript_13589/g.43419 Transcript_13589/m.43419 type:complete len:333 (-) Transcript_13589:36-1034(-)